MKFFLSVILFGLVLSSCKKDNMDAPTTKLNGRLVYKGEPVEVEYDRVPFELYDQGFGKLGPAGIFSQPTTPNNTNTTTTFTQDGKFSMVLYDGNYKFVVRPGQGPFLWPQTGGKADTLAINLIGDQVKDIEVLPYYMVRTPQFAKAGTGVTATFKAEKIITDAVNGKEIQYVQMMVNKTQFVSPTDYIGTITQIAGSAITNPNAITMSVTVPAIQPTQNYVFARVGIKMVGVEDMIFSAVTKISL